MKSNSKVAVVMMITFMAMMLGLSGCDGGRGSTDSSEDVIITQEYSVNINIEDVRLDEVDGLKIYAAGETHYGLVNYHQDGEIDYTLTFTETTDISIIHEDKDLAFTPQVKSVDSSDDNKTLTFRKGKYAENIEQFGDLFEDENIRAIVLGGDLDFDEVEEKFFDLNLNRSLIIDGYGVYGIKGDGSIKISLNDHDLIFKNISFILGEQTDQGDNPDHVASIYMDVYSGGGNIEFYNIEVSQDYADINTFLINHHPGEVVIKDSVIDLDLNDNFINLTSGGNAIIKNNIFRGSSNWGFIRTTNQKRNSTLIIKENNFNDFTGNTVVVSTEWGDFNISVNEIVLEPVNDYEDDTLIKEFIDIALEIHDNLGLYNDMPENYQTLYGYGDADEEVFEYISYSGEVEVANDESHLD